MTKWGIILNPSAGNKKIGKGKTVCDGLKAKGINGEFCFTQYAGHAIELVHQLAAKGIRDFIVVGGDGTVSEVINGLMTCDGIQSTDFTFGIIPCGTGNDWCRYWQIPKKFDQSLSIVLKGKTTAIDIGKLAYKAEKDTVTRYFINSVGIGFDAQIVDSAEKIKKVINGQSWVYFMSLVSNAFIHKSKELTMSDHSGILIDEKVYSMSIANGPYTGGGIKQTPKADPSDGLFDIMVATKPNMKQLVKGISSILRKTYQSNGFIHYFRTHELVINSEYSKAEVDGIMQFNGEAPIKFSIVPHALNMIIP